MFERLLSIFRTQAPATAPVDKAPGSAELNTAVRIQLSRQGDLGLTPRVVTHFLYPMQDRYARPRTEIIDLFEAIDGTLSDASAKGGFVFDHFTDLHPDRFDHFTETLSRDLAELGWSYDGWESPVIKE